MICIKTVALFFRTIISFISSRLAGGEAKRAAFTRAGLKEKFYELVTRQEQATIMRPFYFC